MANSWRTKAQFKVLSNELAQLEGNAFARQILRYIQIASPFAAETSALASLDRNGIDIVVPANEPDIWHQAIQCKGFAVAEEKLGKVQVNQCLKSIDDFDKGTTSPAEYILIYNRIGISEKFRVPVVNRLKQLVESKRVEAARLCSREDFLNDVITQLFEVFREFLFARSEEFRHKVTMNASMGTVSNLPFTVQMALIKSYSLTFEAKSYAIFGDPAKEIAGIGTAAKVPALSCVLGEFGMGKSTLAHRVAAGSDRRALYIPASAFPEMAANTKDFLGHFSFLPQFIESLQSLHPQGISTAILKSLGLLMTEKFFASDNDFILLIDGLDESPLLSTGRGLPMLFDAVSKFQTRTVLIMRTEFWNLNKESLLSGYIGRLSGGPNTAPNRRIRFLTLSPWRNPEILMFIDQRLKEVSLAHCRKNLENLRQLIEANAYQELYADIPKRPLFLDMLADHVEENGVSPASLELLFKSWIDLKIRRDIILPQQLGGRRQGVTETVQSADTVIKLAHRAMTTAAQLMVSSYDGEMVLLPECSYEAIADLVLKGHDDPTGLTLNSLLVIDSFNGSHHSVRFAHRAFQEYFLAKSISEKGVFRDLRLPSEITEWIGRFQGRHIPLPK